MTANDTQHAPTPLVFGQGVNNRPSVSFEFFPPRTEAMHDRLWRAIDKLALLSPDFLSVTYGAGGSTRQRTHQTVTQIGAKTDLKRRSPSDLRRIDG